MEDQAKYEVVESSKTDLVEIDRYNQIIDMALSQGELDRIERWMMLKREYEKDEARKAFFLDLAEFHKVKPVLKKDAFNTWFQSWYTSLGNLLGTYTPILGQFGLSLSLPPKIADGKMVVVAILSHRLGHREVVEMPPVPIDEAKTGRESGQKTRNAIQDIRSTFTYTRAMAVEAVLGVAGTEGTVDDDGNSAGKRVDTINKDQIKTIRDKLRETGKNEKRMLAHLKIDSIENIPADWYDKTIALFDKGKQERVPGEEG